PGAGVFRSDDAGLNWRLIASATEQELPLHIGAIAVDPFDARHIRLAGVSMERRASGGAYVSHDRGASWKREEQVSPAGSQCHAVVFHPSREGVIFAAVEHPGDAGGIWR